MCADTTTIVDEISSPIIASLLSIHPNDATLNELPSQWSPWWAWASNHTQAQPAWLQLMHYFMRPDGDDSDKLKVDVGDVLHRQHPARP